ncbi:Toxin-antitoxin system, RelE/ParE toxin family [Syntrophomonas zehnderi OL-4]|uniref:Toxin-antitoxin system, RelE/ParE toxin family n=1 Tax=Syntrophomonas zehnderi OL-4 TaxID=690567 RepID=A0A0E4C7W8_9FIRM|nr:type II toxin-antitoxin system RelE/ParE family toxin [Syntrophomonas zehnderi]CFX16005.1 Toxin-antitoxin system, RelE/ParE toxin family [Syntrophomonas zehnderi OL-4]
MNSEFKIIFSPKALKQLKDLDRAVQIKIKEGINKLTQYPPRADVIKLKGGQGNELRLRVGSWRIIFEYQFKDRQVHILTIKNRRDVYK